MKYEISWPCCLEIEFTLKPGKRREFARSFEDLIGHAIEGHIKSTVFEDREEPGHMIWIASWSSRESLEGYIRSDQFGIVIGALKVLSSCPGGRLIEESCVRASTVSGPSKRIIGESRFAPMDLGPVEPLSQGTGRSPRAEGLPTQTPAELETSDERDSSICDLNQG